MRVGAAALATTPVPNVKKAATDARCLTVAIIKNKRSIVDAYFFVSLSCVTVHSSQQIIDAEVGHQDSEEGEEHVEVEEKRTTEE